MSRSEQRDTQVVKPKRRSFEYFLLSRVDLSASSTIDLFSCQGVTLRVDLGWAWNISAAFIAAVLKCTRSRTRAVVLKSFDRVRRFIYQH